MCLLVSRYTVNKMLKTKYNIKKRHCNTSFFRTEIWGNLGVTKSKYGINSNYDCFFFIGYHIVFVSSEKVCN